MVASKDTVRSVSNHVIQPIKTWQNLQCHATAYISWMQPPMKWNNTGDSDTIVKCIRMACRDRRELWQLFWLVIDVAQLSKTQIHILTLWFHSCALYDAQDVTPYTEILCRHCQMNPVVLLEVELWAMSLVRNNMSHKVKPVFVARIIFLFPGFVK